MPLNSAWFQARADELRAEEEKAEQERREAETADERERAEARIEKLEKELVELRESQKRAEAEADDEDDEDDDEDEPESKPKTRRGRKHGMVYVNPETGMGEVYQGDDEPDLVPVEEDAA